LTINDKTQNGDDAEKNASDDLIKSVVENTEKILNQIISPSNASDDLIKSIVENTEKILNQIISPALT